MFKISHKFSQIGGLAQSEVCFVRNEKVPGSKPGFSNQQLSAWRNWITRLTTNQEIAGSSPVVDALSRSGLVV